MTKVTAQARKNVSMLFAPLELHPADGTTMAFISQLSTMCPFSYIFKLHSYRVFLVGVLRLIQQLLAIS